MTMQPMQMIEQIASTSIAGLMIAGLLVTSLAAGPGLVQDLPHAGVLALPTSAGGRPVIVDWSFFTGQDEGEHMKKCGGRARWADGTAKVAAVSVTR